MTEKGSDELLAEVADAPVDRAVAETEAQLDAEERRLRAISPAEHELSGAYPDPDETPSGDPPEYDPTPPEEAS